MQLLINHLRESRENWSKLSLSDVDRFFDNGFVLDPVVVVDDYTVGAINFVLL